MLVRLSIGYRIRFNDVSQMQKFGDALKKNIELFKDNLCLSSDGLLDELLQSECLSQYEFEQIRSKTTNTEQVRMLIVRIKDSCPKIVETFLAILQKSPVYNHLYTKVKKDLESVERLETRATCVICYIMNCVYIPDIADFLWTENIISSPLYSDIVDQAPEVRSRHLVWLHIFENLHSLKDRKESVGLLKNALGEKYSHIAEHLDQLPSQSPFRCCCCKRRKLRPRSEVICESECSDYARASSEG